MKSVLSLVVTIVVLLTSSFALAGREWHFQRVVDAQGQSLAGGSTALGMRSDFTWPVVVSGEGTAAMIPGGWVSSSSGIGGGRLDGTTSTDGTKMIFANEMGQIKMFGASGWSNSFVPAEIGPWSSTSVAFTQNNAPAALYQSQVTGKLTLSVMQGTQWTNTTVWDGFTQGPALAYDSYNQANVVFSQDQTLTYGTKGTLTNNMWAFTTPINVPGLRSDNKIDLALTDNDIPYIVYQSYNMLSYTTYDRIQGQWESGYIDYTGDFGNFTVVADRFGGIGIAYFAEQPGGGPFSLGFAHNDGSGLWETEYLSLNIPNGPGSFFPDGSLGLAFDFDNNPVISFSNADDAWIAYDPFVIPEPATCALLLLGAVGVFRSRK